jgi:RimJ/RimL family protein N-acetyltransferase
MSAKPLLEWMANLSFHPMVETDIPLLHEWIQRPHVAQWWGSRADAASLADTKRKYLPRLEEGSAVKGYIANLEGEPIGFIQSYVALGCENGWWKDETDPGVRGIDQFLGDGGKLGQGLGTQMVKAFVRRLFEDANVTKLQTDPNPMNGRAIRCYEKVGFQVIKRIVTPDGPALLMAIAKDRARAA